MASSPARCPWAQVNHAEHRKGLERVGEKTKVADEDPGTVVPKADWCPGTDTPCVGSVSAPTPQSEGRWGGGWAGGGGQMGH